MGFYPQKAAGEIQTDVTGAHLDREFIAHEEWTAAEAHAAATAGVLAAVTDNGASQTIITGFTQPPCARNITATAGGTAASIKAIQVVVTGTDINDEVITETLPVFTVDTAGTVVGSKAFKTVTSVVIPAHDAVTATTAIGYGDKLGLHYARAHIACIASFLANVLEATAAVVTASATVISSNTIDLQSALNGTAVSAYIVV
jgi:hypothetical protein